MTFFYLLGISEYHKPLSFAHHTFTDLLSTPSNYQMTSEAKLLGVTASP